MEAGGGGAPRGGGAELTCSARFRRGDDDVTVVTGKEVGRWRGLVATGVVGGPTWPASPSVWFCFIFFLSFFCKRRER